MRNFLTAPFRVLMMLLFVIIFFMQKKEVREKMNQEYLKSDLYKEVQKRKGLK